MKHGLERFPHLSVFLMQFVRFGIVGFTAFLIDFSLLAFLTELLSINYLVSTTISFTASVLFNYFASMRFVFHHKQDLSRRKELAIFVTLSIIGLAINDGIMFFGVEVLSLHYLAIKVFSTIVVMLWNFITRKTFLDAGSQ